MDLETPRNYQHRSNIRREEPQEGSGSGCSQKLQIKQDRAGSLCQGLVTLKRVAGSNTGLTGGLSNRSHILGPTVMRPWDMEHAQPSKLGNPAR